MRIATRLALGFGLVVALSIVLGIYSLQRSDKQQTLTEHMDSRDFAAMRTLNEIIRNANQLRDTQHEVLLSAVLPGERARAQSPVAVEERWRELGERGQKSITDLASLVAEWETKSVTPTRAATWRKVRIALEDATKALRSYSPEVEHQFQLINSNNLQAALALNPEVERVTANYQDRLNDVEARVQDQIELGRAEVVNISDKTRQSILIVLIITTLTGAIFALIIYRSITVPLWEFIGVVEEVGKGDLTQQIAIARVDELGDLGRSLGMMVKSLKEVASETRLVAESLNAASTEILASTQEQAASTLEQAAAVQQANATMAEISQSGAQISDRARQVATAAGATSNASAVGLKSVRNTASIMESIREQAEAVAENVISLSDKTQAVGDIVASVNDIAEQSHLLALNAAIQAALAGEQGHSFSVVASEMKALSAQSKQATAQVRKILGDIQKSISGSVMLTEEAVKRVEAGQQQAKVAEKTIHELTQSIEEAIRAFQQIVGGSNQQQIGFDQVTQAFRSIGIASQETATSTKQSERAATDLTVLAQQLRQVVERYKV